MRFRALEATIYAHFITILIQLVHNVQCKEIKGESLRKKQLNIIDENYQS